MRIVQVALLSLIVVGYLFCAGPARADMPADQPMIGTVAPDFELPGLSGDTLSLASFRGRYVIMHFGTSR